MIVVRDIDHVVLRVADIDRSLAFWRDALGCPIEKIQDDIGLWQLRAGASLIDLVPISGKLGSVGSAAPASEGRNMDHVCLRVDPFDPAAIAAHLKAHGIAHGEVVTRYGARGNGPSIYVTDPDGNTVELKGPPASP